jgi:putative Holliday junction resolvase
MDGTFGPAAQKTRDFIDILKSKTTCRVVSWDERLTTVSAQRSLHEAGKNARAQKAMIDQVAAQILLQSWLDSQA